MKTPYFFRKPMVRRDDDSFFVICPELDLKLEVTPASSDRSCCWQLRTADGARHVTELRKSTGPQAAANAAQRWLVERSELTLKLASKRAA